MEKANKWYASLRTYQSKLEPNWVYPEANFQNYFEESFRFEVERRSGKIVNDLMLLDGELYGDYVVIPTKVSENFKQNISANINSVDGPVYEAVLNGAVAAFNLAIALEKEKNIALHRLVIKKAENAAGSYNAGDVIVGWVIRI